MFDILIVTVIMRTIMGQIASVCKGSPSKITITGGAVVKDSDS